MNILKPHVSLNISNIDASVAFYEKVFGTPAIKRRPGYAKAFSRTTHTNHDVAEARLGEVKARTLVVMGAADPDFHDPKAEADWIAATLRGSAVIVPEAGHYPQSQQAETTNETVIAFIRDLGIDA